MSYVEVRKFDNRDHAASVEIALKEFKRKMKKEEILDELKRKEFYMQPSDKRRFKRKEALRRRKRDDRKQDWLEKQQDE